MIAPVRRTDGSWLEETTIARAAGYTLDQVDGCLGALGTPTGVPSYRPPHATGEDFLHSDLYRMPPEVWARIRAVLLQDLDVRAEGPDQVMLFVYDNDTFIVESFRSEPVAVRILVDQAVTALHDVQTDQVIEESQPILDWRGKPTDKIRFDVTLAPHSYRAFRNQS